MKIDVHVHTRKTKKGDAHSREITPERFAEVVLSTDVKIVAITNHNLFDLVQYNSILDHIQNAVQVWPGIELDIEENGKRGHLLVIVSPDKKQDFFDAVRSVTNKVSPDDFSISIGKTVETFNDLDPVYIAHYLQKKPDIPEDVLSTLAGLLTNNKRIIKEATNSISAGIFIAHGHPSIYGSDVQDWDEYANQVNLLPELRLPVESFEQFCLLLEKDATTINTLLDKKTPENLCMKPFEDDTEINIKVYNDINVFFGAKGTGKSCILEAIAKHYSSKGIRASKFESGADSLSNKYNLRGKDLSINLNNYGIEYCTDEIKRLKAAKECDVTRIQNYRNFYELESQSKNAKKIRIKEITPLIESKPERKFKEYSEAQKKILEMIDYISQSQPISEVTESEMLTGITKQLQAVADKLMFAKWEYFADWKSISLLNNAVKLFRYEVTRKTGTLSKPAHTGFNKYAVNRLKIKKDAAEILRNLSVSIEDEIEHVGTLGPDKGELKCSTSYCFQDGSLSNSKYSPLKSVKKTPQKEFSKCIKEIEQGALRSELFSYIRELNAIDDVDKIETVYELLQFWRRFELNGEAYEPSKGEDSMLNLHAELAEEKDVYILDEPDKSLGNEYINDVIIPLINDKARQGKSVFIATHDGNIAVRTLPYNSIYRCHNRSGYSTYVGNPFSNNLVNISNPSDILDWKKISMKTLEGGEAAFGERGKIYGNY